MDYHLASSLFAPNCGFAVVTIFVYILAPSVLPLLPPPRTCRLTIKPLPRQYRTCGFTIFDILARLAPAWFTILQCLPYYRISTLTIFSPGHSSRLLVTYFYRCRYIIAPSGIPFLRACRFTISLSFSDVEFTNRFVVLVSWVTLLMVEISHGIGSASRVGVPR